MIREKINRGRGIVTGKLEEKPERGKVIETVMNAMKTKPKKTCMKSKSGKKYMKSKDVHTCTKSGAPTKCKEEKLAKPTIN